MKKILLIVFAGLLITGCKQVKEVSTVNGPAAVTSVSEKAPFDADYMSLAVMYYQRAAETRALYYQGYNCARMVIDNDLKVNTAAGKAIVLDIDETALDNSPYEAQCILGPLSYPERWDEWVYSAKAEAVPGAVDFLNYAADKGYTIFYVTNRKAKFREATLKNLKDQGFPMADSLHVMLKTNDNSKEARRLEVMKTYSIVLLLGDNLGDFSKIFDGTLTMEERSAKADQVKGEFGTHFIVFPNPMYGDWEMAAYPDPAASPAVKDSLRKASLKGF